MRDKLKQMSLVLCLFFFLLVVLGGALHLSSAGALISAVTGAPLVIYVLNRIEHCFNHSITVDPSRSNSNQTNETDSSADMSLIPR